jgi:hypothetical protein
MLQPVMVYALVSQGYLMPRFHKNYWMGMTANVVKNFTNTDITLSRLDSGRAYLHWGVYMWVTQ